MSTPPPEHDRRPVSRSDGSTVSAEHLAEVQAAARQDVADMTGTGEREPHVTLTLRVVDELYDQLVDAARRARLPLEAFAIRELREAVSEHDRRRPRRLHNH